MSKSVLVTPIFANPYFEQCSLTVSLLLTIRYSHQNLHCRCPFLAWSRPTGQWQVNETGWPHDTYEGTGYTQLSVLGCYNDQSEQTLMEKYLVNIEIQKIYQHGLDEARRSKVRIHVFTIITWMRSLTRWRGGKVMPIETVKLTSKKIHCGLK